MYLPMTDRKELIMKKAYITPEMEIIEFECEDVITTSGAADIELDPNETGIINIID